MTTIRTGPDLVAARKRLGLTQTQLAAELRLSRETGRRSISRYEQGEIPVPGPVQVAVEGLERARHCRCQAAATDPLPGVPPRNSPQIRS